MRGGAVLTRSRRILVSESPELMVIWSPKNTISPSTITTGSNVPVLWRCGGHIYTASPKNKTSKNPQGCSYCSGRKTLAGFNDLETLHPELVDLWWDGNTVKPSEVRPLSNQVVGWVCDKGHIYNYPISKVVGRGYRCYFCSGHRVLTGFNDLATTHPELVDAWSPNNSENPSEVSYGFRKKFLWLCKNDHEYAAQIVWRLQDKVVQCVLTTPYFQASMT